MAPGAKRPIMELLGRRCTPRISWQLEEAPSRTLRERRADLASFLERGRAELRAGGPLGLEKRKT